MGRLTWNEHFDYAQAVLGYTPEEAQQYAHRKVLEDPPQDTARLCLVCESTSGGECEFCPAPTPSASAA